MFKMQNQKQHQSRKTQDMIAVPQKNLKLVGFSLFPVDEIPIKMASLLGFSRSFSDHRCLNHFDGH